MAFRTADRQAGAEITVRHLLTHTGGFEGDIGAPTSDGADALERLVDEHVSQAEQHLQPGSFFSDCSAGIGVLGRIVEVRRWTTYNRALRRRHEGARTPCPMRGRVGERQTTSASPRARSEGNRQCSREVELEVHGLVADGLSNAEIASRLHLSRRTVEHRVSAVRAECGVSTRSALARN